MGIFYDPPSKKWQVTYEKTDYATDNPTNLVTDAPTNLPTNLSTSIENGTAFITTILGEEVGSKVDLNTTKSLNITTLSPGIYYLNIETATQRGSVSFVKK